MSQDVLPLEADEHYYGLEHKNMMSSWGRMLDRPPAKQSRTLGHQLPERVWLWFRRVCALVSPSPKRRSSLKQVCCFAVRHKHSNCHHHFRSQVLLDFVTEMRKGLYSPRAFVRSFGRLLHKKMHDTNPPRVRCIVCRTHNSNHSQGGRHTRDFSMYSFFFFFARNRFFS